VRAVARQNFHAQRDHSRNQFFIVAAAKAEA
jgi:hypothetical protein